MHPLLGPLIPSPTGRDDMQMGVVLAIAAMGLNYNDVATLERLATDTAEDIIQAPHPTTHEWTQHRFGLLIKRFPEDLRYGQDYMAVDDAFMEHLAHLADPVVHINFRAAQAQR